MNVTKIEDRREREKRIVRQMIRIYCRGNHGTKAGQPCERCQALLDYAAARVDHCPHMETKTFCSNCKTHCYQPQKREQIRQVMRWSGSRMIFHHPVMAVHHVIEMKKEKKLLQQ